MDGFGWLIALLVLLFLGNSKLGLSLGTFTAPNAVPTPDGLPATTIQNQTNGPNGNQNNANAPPPWAPGTGGCTPSPCAPAALPPCVVDVSPLAPVSTRLPLTAQRVTFSQGSPLAPGGGSVNF